MKALLILLALTAASQADVVFKKSQVTAPFLEQFDASWSSRWKSSEAVKQVPEGFKAAETDNVDEMFRYRGEWSVEGAKKDGVSGDQGLVVKTQAAHHAISASFVDPIDPEGKDLVIQYDLKLQDDLACGGAYIKLLTESPQGIKYQEFDDKTPYTIMFGPDKCGATNKVHFIFRHKNPKTGEWEEKHLKNAPEPKTDSKTHLYTLLVQPNNSYSIFIDNELAKTGSLLEDFDPAVNPPQEINDPSDVKPSDWVDEPKVPDESAVKPEDWDEEAPRMIPDEDATVPEDWLENEEEYVPDPSAEKPEDWDNEEDGEWVAPQVPNPSCEKVSGCGKWNRPNKPNPEYKGKWYPPMIDNPAYKGPWEAKKIPNPDYFEDLLPSKFTKLSGVGIELWTMQSGIMFDNFYFGHSLEDARELAAETFATKKELEAATAKVEEEKAKEDAANAEQEAEAKKESTDAPAEAQSQLDAAINTARAFFTAASSDPVSAFKTYPFAALITLLAAFAPLLFLVSSPAAKPKKDTTSPKKKPVEEEIEADDEQENKTPRKSKRTVKDE